MNHDLKTDVIEQLKKSRQHLEYSYKKVIKFSLEGELDEETLETLESFASRFARFSDIAISKYLKLLAKEQDPAFNGSVIDCLNIAEKHGWVENAKDWRTIRELRNLAAHEYEAKDYKRLYEELIKLAPILLHFKI